LQFQNRSPFFITAHNETLSVAMRIGNPDRAALTIEA